MKYQTTKKAVMNGYGKILCLGYCDLQDLFSLAGEEPIAYTAGVYGWNANIYHVNHNAAIVTGYRPFGNIRADYDFNREIEKQASEIRGNWDIPYEEKREKGRELFEKLIEHYGL